MMADHGYVAEERGPTTIYTPSLDSEEDLLPGSARSLTERDYRLFNFTKEGRSWAKCLFSESTIREADIKKKSQKTKKPGHGVAHQLEKMSVPRRNAIQDLVRRVEDTDPDRDRWEILSIDNNEPEWTKRTGEVRGFSVVLGRASTLRQRAGPLSQDRRRSSFRQSPPREYAVPARRGSKAYHPSQSPVRDNRGHRPSQSQGFKTSQTILEDDPFGNQNLFSQDGKPINAHGSTPFVNAGLPPHIPLDEPIGAKKDTEKDKSKKNKGLDDAEDVDVDALLGGFSLKDSPGPFGIFPEQKSKKSKKMPGGFEDGIEIINVGEEIPRGRAKRDSFHPGDKTPKHRRSRSKSKSRPRRPSVHIPRTSDEYRPLEITSKHRSKAYYGSHGSATTASITSDHSVLEAEYEDYSSSGSSAYELDPYASIASEYRVKNYHRRGPPSPEQRYETFIPHDRQYVTTSGRVVRPARAERMLSDTAVARYTGQTPRSARPRDTVVTHYPAPQRYIPHSAGGYNYSTGLVPFPGEREKTDDARAYMMDRGGEPRSALGRDRYSDYDRYERREREAEERDREIQLLERERNVALREAELHQEAARRASVRTTSKYTHEPRLQRRYTEAAYDDRGYHA